MTRRGWLLFVTMCVIWGLPYLFIRIAVDHLSPPTLVFVRTATASLVLLPIALLRGDVRAVLARWRPLVVFAVIEIMIPWVLLNHAEQRITSSLAGLLVAAVPLFGALAFLLTRHAEKFTTTQVGGLVLGFLGVGALVGLDVGDLDLLAITEMMIVAHCYASGPIILTRSLARILAPHNITVNAISPGFIKSGSAPDEELQKMVKNIPAGYVGELKDAVAAVKFLLSDEARYVTGANIHLSGGWGI